MRPIIVAVPLALAALAFVTPRQESFESLARESLARIDGRIALPGLRDSVEVIRDRWGVPHIYARNLDDLFFAQGFTQAQDRLWQMEMYRRTYEGTLAEILGPAHVRNDRVMRLLRYRGPFDDAEWKSYHPEGRRIFDAFARGVNAFIAQAGDRLPVEFRLTGIRPRPWTAEVALLRTTTAMPVADALDELRLARDVARYGADSAARLAQHVPARPLIVPKGVDYSAIDADVVAALAGIEPDSIRPPLLPRYRALRGGARGAPGDDERSPGSNNWVLGGRLTASGHVYVANDPHRNVRNPSIRYIVHLDAPGWRLMGATEPVLPGVMIGHSGRIGWGLTIAGHDQADVYVEELNPANHLQARHRGLWETLRTERDTIRVRGARPVVVTHKFSRHGPIFHEDGARHRAYALRTTAHLPGTAGYLSALRYHALRDCREFLDAQRYWLAPSENMICGDADGNIAWQASGAAPRRPNWDGRLPVPGTGEYEWAGQRADLPRELNPARGWIATANHDIHPPGYDPPLFFSTARENARFERIAAVLSSRAGFTMADMQALQHDAHSAAGARDIQAFQGWSAADPLLERARRAIAEWDAQHRRDSHAAAVYHFAGGIIPAEARAAAAADRRRELLEPVLRSALDSLRNRFGPDTSEWRWGQLNRSTFFHPFVSAYDLPAVERHGGRGFVASVGATFRQILDMQDLDASMATNAPGQSGQPFSPYYGNLVDMYGRAEYFPMVFSRNAVEGAAAHRLTLVPR